jgi:hypothetical protein
MKRLNIFSSAILVIAVAMMLITPGCFGSMGITGNSATATPTVVKPQPRVESVTATTSGTHNSYYVTLAIKVKNDGAKGTVLLVAKVTQNGKTIQDEQEVFLKQGESHETELTFPLVWEGGDFTSDVKTIIP